MPTSRDMRGEDLRKRIYPKLTKLFSQLEVKTKWRIGGKRKDDLDPRLMYAPEIDLAVGPFNVEKPSDLHRNEIDDAYKKYRNLLFKINEIAEVKIDDSGHGLGYNPRCLVAIEVGGSGSRKHYLGDIFNSHVVGKIGIVVGANNKSTEIYKRIFEFINYCVQVGKLNDLISNVMVLDGKKFLDFLIKHEKSIL